MTEISLEKYNKVLALKKANPTWTTRKCCAKAKISIPTFYEIRKEYDTVPDEEKTILTWSQQPEDTLPLWKQVAKSNLSAETKMKILETL